MTTYAMRVQLTLTELADNTATWEGKVDRTFAFRELLRHRINIPPAATAKDLTPLLAELGADAQIKALAVISDLDGVVLHITTIADVGIDADNVATLGCYPMFFMGKESGIDVSVPFSMSVELPSGDETAHIELVAYE